MINATAQTLVGTTPRTASASFNLAVSGLPQKPPAFTVAAPGDGSATFSWTTPVGSVDHFTISYSADNGVTWQPIATAAGGASSVTIASGALPSGAGPGSGAFAIQTTNSAGTSSQQLDPDYGALDNDMDGLTNQQEADEGTDPNNPDTDGDGVPDGQDAWPNEKLLSFSRIGTPAYAVIDLGPASSGMFPWALNNKGDIVYGQRVDQTNNRYFFVPAGQTIASAIEMKPSDSNPAPTGWTRDPYGYFVPSLSDNGEAAGRWIMKNSADSTDPTSPKYEVTWDPVSHDLDYRGMASADDQVTTNLGPGWLKAFNDRQCPSAVAVNASGQILDTMGSAGGIYVAGPGAKRLTWEASSTLAYPVEAEAHYRRVNRECLRVSVSSFRRIGPSRRAFFIIIRRCWRLQRTMRETSLALDRVITRRTTFTRSLTPVFTCLSEEEHSNGSATLVRTAA